MLDNHEFGTPENEDVDIEYSGLVNGDMNAAAQQTQMDKFHASQGHGFAAEQANHLCDILSGKDATIIGGDNAKNGADRLVDGISIQAKYCQSAQASVDAAFQNGKYRYVNPDGSLMQLEVPADQYDKAVEALARKIQNGQVPGISDPDEAKNIVRKGSVTYAQACNVAKFGTIESLTFDAVNGAVICGNTIGISATLTFARSLWDGKSIDAAVETAVYSGLQAGGAAFATSVISAQLGRTALNNTLMSPTNELVKLIGPKACANITNALRSGANIYGAVAMNNVAKLLRGNFVTSAVMTVVLSAKDIGHAFDGKISGKQLFKNITTIAGGILGGIGGYALGCVIPIIGGPATGIIVSCVGGSLAGNAVNTVVGTFVEDDAVELVRIIQDVFCLEANNYLLTEEEVEIITDDLAFALTPEKLLDMYASPDHRAFADNLIREQIEKLLNTRCRILLPNDREFVAGLGRAINDVAEETGIFASNYLNAVDPLEIAHRLLPSQETTSRVARKAWYATKQMNLALLMAEIRLKKIAQDNTNAIKDMSTIDCDWHEIEKKLNLFGGE